MAVIVMAGMNFDWRARCFCDLALQHQHINLCRIDTAAIHTLELKASLKAQRSNSFLKNSERNPGIHQGRQQHIPANA